MTAFEALLEVQDRDTAVDQLRHRRAHLPERAHVAALEERMGALDARVADVGAQRAVVASRQSRLEEEVRSLDQRIAEIERRLYSGTVTAHRDLQAMAAEAESLKARRSAVEDEVLVAMEEGEPLADELAALESERAALEAEVGQARDGLVRAEADVEAHIAAQEADRAGISRRIPTDLLSTYERLRAKLGGVGAARLVGSSCSGCHLTLPAAEVARIKREPPDALVLCDQCGRILVR